MMENREYLISLFDIYQELLTETEKETFKNYYEEDLSLSEIAENRSISKSSVGKTLNSAETKLKDYEDKLNILKNKKKLQNLLTKEDIEYVKKELLDIITSN